MKKLFPVFLLLIICLSSFASFEAEVPKEIVNELNLTYFSKSRVTLETGFGSSVFINPEVANELVGKDIMKISLIFTTYREADDFDQVDLNAARWKNIQKLFLDLKLDTEIKVKEIGIDKCLTSDCAENQLHGFIVEYRKETLNHINLQSQKSTFNAQEIIQYTGSQGTKIHVEQNSFMDAQGNDVVGEVDLVLKEALTPEDIVTANLLTITDKGEALESGGMINVMAYQNGRVLTLKPGKEVKVNIPKKKNQPEMKVWEGEWVDGQLQWNNPRELDKTKVDVAQDIAVVEEVDEVFENIDIVNNIKISAGQFNTTGLPIMEIQWWNDLSGDLDSLELITADTSYIFCKEEYTIDIGIEKDLSEFQAIKVMRWFENQTMPAGVPFRFWGWHRIERTDVSSWNRSKTFANLNPQFINTAFLDPSTSNAFAMKGMGWANIDRLANFSNSRTAKLEINCVNDSLIKDVSIILVIPDKGMFLPGYKMRSGNYCFAHNDNETRYSLPVGDEAFIVMTGSVGNENQTSIKKIVLGDNDVEDTKCIPMGKQETLETIKKLI